MVGLVPCKWFPDFCNVCAGSYFYCSFSFILLPFLFDGDCSDNMGVYVSLKNFIPEDPQ